MDFGNHLEQFSLKWNNFNDNMKSGFHDLLRTEDFVDVTIAAEGKLIQAHKMVLSVCSPYFKNIFKTNPCQHPVIFLKDVTHKELSGILHFMYLGEVSIQQEDLGRFLKTAEALQIKGLTGDDSDSKDEEVEESSQDNCRHSIITKTEKLINSDSEEKEICVKKMKLSSTNDLIKNNGQPSVQNQLEAVINNVQNSYVSPKIELAEGEFSDVESDRISLKEETVGVSDSLLQLQDSITDAKYEEKNSPLPPTFSGQAQDMLSCIQGLSNECISLPMADRNQEIRFVMSPRMRPCLVFNNYLYIKDHVGLASPGQVRTIYWRCKDITCKARCIQRDFRFRLKRNTYHQHQPNVDPSYFPIQLNNAYDVIKYLN